MSKYPDLSDADEIIMEILWRGDVVSSAAIVKEVENTLSWFRQTNRGELREIKVNGDVKRF